MTDTSRRYDIDWLRVIAIGLLLVYHIAIAFQPWGAFIGFIQSPQPLNFLWVPMSMLNIWRIPLLFMVSGMGVCFAIRKRNWKQLLLERGRRILLPFLFGIVTMVPLHTLVWQKYYHQELTYSVNAGHLWFLANIFIYVLILSPLIYLLKMKAESDLAGKLRRLICHPLGWLIIALVFILEVLLFTPDTFEAFAMSWHGFVLGLLAFLSGFLFVYSGERFWINVRRGRWFFLGSGLVLFLFRYLVFHLQVPAFIKVPESFCWIFSAFGFGYLHLNRPGKVLQYLRQAAYPVYILHMFFLYLASFLIFPLEIPAIGKFFLVVLFTFLGCFAAYDLIIKRTAFIRPLFGLRMEQPQPPNTRIFKKLSGSS